MPIYTPSDLIDIFDVINSEIDSDSNEITLNLRGEDFGESSDDAETVTGTAFGALGVTSRPYDSDQDESGAVNGRAQAIVHRLADCVVAMRDTRSAAVIGAMAPGETCVHSTEPEHNSRIYCKATKQTVIMSKDSTDKDMIIILDGSNDTVNISAFKQMITMDKTQGITLATEGAYINIGKTGTITIFGNVFIQGKIQGPAIQVVGTATGVTPGTGAVPVVGTLA